MRHSTTILALTFAAFLSPAVHAADPADAETGGRLSAVARVGVARADPGGYAGQSPDDPNRGTTSVAATINLESTHAVVGRGWDVSLDFDAGYQPLFVMVKAPAWLTARPAFINGLLTTVGGRIARASSSTETAVVLRVGTARVSEKSTAIESHVTTTRASIAANDIAEWAFFFDGGVEFRWYVRAVADVHRTNRTLDPLIRLYGGARHDQRFHRAGDLSGFKDPTGRVFFTAEVLPIRIGRRGDGGLHLSVGGGFALEAALRTTQRLPSGFRAFAGANLDLTHGLH